MKFLSYTLGTDSDLGPAEPPSAEVMTQMGELMRDATAAGVLVATGGWTPIADGTKVRYDDGEFSVTDGPFGDEREPVGGWALLEVADRAEAVEWAKRFLSISGGGESTLRQVFTPDEAPPWVTDEQALAEVR